MRNIYNPNEINEDNFDSFFLELPEHTGGIYDYKYLLTVCLNISEEQTIQLMPYIVDRFITENFEMAEWVERFRVLEKAKEIYALDMFGKDADFSKYKLTDSQDIFISKNYPADKLETLIIPVKLFQESNLAPMEIIIYVLHTEWAKSYSMIAQTLNRDPRTIETTFKRAAFKMESGRLL